MIELKNITKVYKTANGSVEALKGVSLKVQKGEIYGIVGLSGAGKSTLIRCINLLEKPTTGEIWVEGINLLNLSQKELRDQRRNIGMIFQNYNLLSSRTVFGNISCPLELAGLKKEIIKERVNYLLDIVNLSDKINAYPSQLSGGQKQRVAIARALATNPKILLCDEATSALDPITSRSILSLIKDINEKFDITVVLITHQMEVIKQICDKVAVIKDGLIVEDGPIGKVFNNPKDNYTNLLMGNDIFIKGKVTPLKLIKNIGVGGI